MDKIMALKKDGSAKKKNWRAIENYQSYNIPILYLDGSTGAMTKDTSVTMSYIYGARSGTCTLKWQGASSILRPKKNYTIKFDTAFEAVSGWGKQKKYVLKANFVDSSHARNIVCAKLWGQIVKCRNPANETLNALPNGGAIDGFPVIISLNGRFYGLYTWNIPKDGWMFGMDETGQQAILCAEYNNNGATAFKGLATFEEDSNGEVDFELEYSSDDQSDWVLTSVNRLLAAVMDSDGTNITYTIGKYLDWASAIDYYIHAVLTCNYDGIWRNYLLYTHDGIKWGFGCYDMDVVLGLRAMGKYFYPADMSVTFADVAGMHKVFELIWKYMRPQLRARYNELRASAMSEYNVTNEFYNFACGIPLPLYVDDARLWNTIPSTSANTTDQIVNYYDFRCRNADKWIAVTAGETDLPEQVDPDTPEVYTVSNSLTGCATSNNASTVTEGDAYTATISAADGYTLEGATVKVSMGGTDITSTAYSGGVITIAEVTGNVVIAITAQAVAADSYTNVVPTAIDTDGSIYNGVGWKGATRLSASSGSEKTQDNAGVTGFISVKSGDIVRFKDSQTKLLWNEDGMVSGHCAVVYYDATFAFLGSVTLQPAYYGILAADTSGSVGISGVDPTGTTADGGIVTIAVPDNASIAYIRLGMSCVATDGSNLADLIVTVNEEIA